MCKVEKSRIEYTVLFTCNYEKPCSEFCETSLISLKCIKLYLGLIEHNQNGLNTTQKLYFIRSNLNSKTHHTNMRKSTHWNRLLSEISEAPSLALFEKDLAQFRTNEFKANNP